MLSFRSIFFAAAAFATIASAIPTVPPTPNVLGVRGVRGGVRGGGMIASGSAAGSAGGSGGLRGGGGGLNSGLSGLSGLLSGLLRPVTAKVTKRDPTSPGDIFKTCSDGVELVVVKIDAAVNVDGGTKNIDHRLVFDLLGEIVDLLQVAITDLKAVVGAELTLNGDVCTLRELAEVVTCLLILVIKVVWRVLSIDGLVDVTLCGVISTIVALLCELLEVVFALVAGLKVEVVDLVKPFVDQCDLTRFTQILAILGLHA